MSPQVLSITNTPQQVAEGIAVARSTKSFTTGSVTIAILVHNKDNAFLLYNTFNEAQDANGSPSLTLAHILCHEVDLRPFAAGDEADVSIQSITEDAITAKLGPVEVKNMTVLHAGGEVQTAKTVLFVSCTVESSEVPDMFMSDLRWLPETVLQNADLKGLAALLGVDGIGRLLGAREHWKQGITLDTIPDLVSSLPCAPAYMVTGRGKVEAEEDSGYQPDSESSAGSDGAEDIGDVDENYTLKVEDADDDDDLPGLVADNDFVFGDENLEKSSSGQSQQLTRYRAQPPRRPIQQTYTSVDPETDDDDDDFFENKKKPSKSEKADRRVFQADSTITRGSRVPRKQQKNPPLMVDPAYLHEGPRFARPAQKLNGHRFGTKISKTKISLGTDKAIKKGHDMWDDLFKVSSETRLV